MSVNYGKIILFKQNYFNDAIIWNWNFKLVESEDVIWVKDV
jgi:hypothetical protein